MNHYVVLARFSSENPIDNPQDYVESAVGEYRGCYPPDDPAYTIDSDSVRVSDISKVPLNNSLMSVIAHVL